MLRNYEKINSRRSSDFQSISRIVSEELQNKEIHEVEEILFRSALILGHSYLGAFLEKKGYPIGSGVNEKWNYPVCIGLKKVLKQCWN